jgi:hypothetical protein
MRLFSFYPQDVGETHSLVPGTVPLNFGLRDFWDICSTIRTIKSRRMRWAGHMKEIGNSCKILVGNPEVRDRLEDLGVYGRIILDQNGSKRNRA